ncbi:MAG: NUDIX domain-containing protein [Planctomycetes bacterium]|nr:NUDIX domain-containing protein [Planctomycetota bacterium]
MDMFPHYRHCPYDGTPLDPGDPPRGRRPRCTRCEFVDYQNPRPCVAILILDENRVLLARRAVEPAKGMWDIPGGFIEANESAEQAVVREAREETDLHVQVAAYLGSLPDVYGHRGVPTLNFCFLTEVVAGEVKAQSDVAELQWVDLNCLPDRMAFAHQQQMLHWAQARVLGGR